MNSNQSHDENPKPILVVGGTGKTGRRVAERLKQRGIPIRMGSRAATPPFDWENADGWSAVLTGVTSVYATFYPDLAVPGADTAIQSFIDLAEQKGVKRIVLLTGRGEDEAEQCEQIVVKSQLDWTILRCSWFCQNFSESFLRDQIMSGEVALPVDDVREPFVDAADIADAAVAALTGKGHERHIYELTGPKLITFEEAVREISAAAGRQVGFKTISHDEYASNLRDWGTPPEFVSLVRYLFETVLDGRNESLTDGVLRATGKQPRSFADFARTAASAGVWRE